MNENEVDILLVDDSQEDVELTLHALRTEGLANHVFIARDGEEALDFLFCTGPHAQRSFDHPPKLVLLDLKMPGIGGLEACRRIRVIFDVPILVISVLRTQGDKVQAFDAGADDYLVKPFGIQELLSRIHALRRRTSGSDTIAVFESAGLKVDFERRRVIVDSEQVHLTPSEFELLRYLMLHEGKPVSHQILLQSLWGPKYTSEIQRLRVTINQLRRKIEKDPDRIRYIHTEHQFGYRFEPVLKKSAKRNVKA